MSISVLVTGGAGYIGSHMVKLLNQLGYDVTTVDDFSSGHRDAVVGGGLIEGDLGDRVLLERLFSEGKFQAVMHFAGSIQVGESLAQPALYYQNNLTKTLTLLDVMLQHGIGRFVFSSTAAVYGQPVARNVREDHARRPVSPYGRSKKFIEDILADYELAYGLHSISLRYFNAAGADPEGELGERHEPETHLIPLVLKAAAGRRDKIVVYGNDYDTEDGTCVRDFVHVRDLCLAHELALRHLLEGGGSDCLNLGSGCGYSVWEAIEAARRVTGRAIPAEIATRRPGDPARLVADTERGRRALSWRPQFGLEDMIAHAWAWERGLE